jgi:predicted MPP superfamily phosphohydrolase
MSTRRTRILVALALVAVVVAALAAVAWHDTTQVTVRQYVIPVRGIEREVRIVHVADLHHRTFGPGQGEIEAALAGQTFDAAIITGDLLRFQGDDRGPAFELLTVLERHAPAVLFIRGNHDDEHLGTELETRGAAYIEGARVARFGDDLARVTVVSADPDGKIAAMVPVRTGLLLVAMHQPPTVANLGAARRVTSGTQVFLAGHTHGGQIRIPGIGAIFAPLHWDVDPADPKNLDCWFPDLRGSFVQGVYARGDQTVEVTPGLGTTQLGFRLFDQAEISIVRLVPAP